jgi:hypothetical protein
MNVRFGAFAFAALLMSGHFLSPALTAQGAAGGAMPDPRQMSGIPLPVADVPAGTVFVRVIRGSLSNAISNHRVELRGPGTSLDANTNGAGRAEFPGIKPGARIRALTIVGGERLESQEFAMPATGGIRLMLVATDPEAETRAAEDRRLAEAPAQPGMVVLGEQSRFVVEFNDEGMAVFNILQILNTARTPVNPSQPLVFDLPQQAEGAALLEGSSPHASVVGRRVTVSGPFAPGMTLVQFAYSVHNSGGTLTLEQRLPVPLTELALLAQKVGELRLSSPQVAAQREMTAEGQIYILAQGPAIKTGDVLTLTFSGLPHEPTWPRSVALALAVLILAAGAWGSVSGTRGAAAGENRRKKLEARRDRLFEQLTSLEGQHREGRIDPQRYAAVRRDLVNALERVYAELDEEAAA